MKFLRENNLTFPEDLRIAEDFNFWVKALVKAKKISYINEWLYNYRQDFDNNSSATGDVDSSKALDFGKSLKDIHGFIENQGGYSNKKLGSAMKRAVVDHSLYALDITEKNLGLNKKVFDYLHDDILVYFGVTKADCHHPPHAERLGHILTGDYEGYIFGKLYEYKTYSNELVYEVDLYKKRLSNKEIEVAELSGRVEYMNSLKGMVRTPLGKVKQLAKRATKKIIR